MGDKRSLPTQYDTDMDIGVEYLEYKICCRTAGQEGPWEHYSSWHEEAGLDHYLTHCQRRKEGQDWMIVKTTHTRIA
jgi:hypothetical protein